MFTRASLSWSGYQLNFYDHEFSFRRHGKKKILRSLSCIHAKRGSGKLPFSHKIILHNSLVQEEPRFLFKLNAYGHPTDSMEPLSKLGREQPASVLIRREENRGAICNLRDGEEHAVSSPDRWSLLQLIYLPPMKSLPVCYGPCFYLMELRQVCKQDRK